MIEAGTDDEIKQSILGNLTFRPDFALLTRIKVSFEAQECKVETVTLKDYKCGKGDAFCQWSVVVVSFESKRSLSGALAKTLRAVRAARLSMYQFNHFGKKLDGTHRYAVELRENE